MSTILNVKKPPITVLMSVYNGARWLEDAIQSVLNQTFDDFEFIIVNDGSKDSSLEIINRLAANDCRIVVIDKHNSGLADSLNHGINHAQGEWIARIDADDLCAPERLKKQYELAQINSSLVLIGSGLLEIDEYGRSGKVYQYPLSHNALLNQLTTSRRFFAHSSALYRAETVKKIGGYRLRIKRAQDWDLWLRLSEVGQIACLRAPLVKIRKHANQISYLKQGRRQKIDSRVALVSYWLRRRGLADPVSAAFSETDFNAFREWVAGRLQENCLFEYLDFVLQIKQQLSAAGKLHSGLLKIYPLLLREPGFVLRYLRQALVGERITKRLAAEWESRIKLCAE